MAVGSFVLKLEAEAAERVAESVRALAGVDAHSVPNSSDLIVVLEAETRREMEDLALKQIASIDGVLGVYLTYLHLE